MFLRAILFSAVLLGLFIAAYFFALPANDMYWDYFLAAALFIAVSVLGVLLFWFVFICGSIGSLLSAKIYKARKLS